MVTIQEAQQELQRQKQLIEQQRRSIQEQKIKPISRQELSRVSGIAGREAIRQKIPERELALQQQKQAALSQISEYEEKVISPYEKELKEAEQQQAFAQRQWEQRMAALERSAAKREASAEAQNQEYYQTIKDIKSAGYKPILDKSGAIIGVDTGTQSISIEALQKSSGVSNVNVPPQVTLQQLSAPSLQGFNLQSQIKPSFDIKEFTSTSPLSQFQQKTNIPTTTQQQISQPTSFIPKLQQSISFDRMTPEQRGQYLVTEAQKNYLEKKQNQLMSKLPEVPKKEFNVLSFAGEKLKQVVTYTPPPTEYTTRKGEKKYVEQKNVGEFVGIPLLFVRKVAETSGKGWEDIYSRTVSKLPEKYQPVLSSQLFGFIPPTEYTPSKYLPDTPEKYYAKGKIITPKQFGSGVATAVELGAYTIPGAYTPLLISSIGSGLSKGYEPEKYYEYKPEYYTEYLEAIQKEGIKEGYRELTEEEFKPLVREQGISNIKREGFTEAITSGAILGGSLALKGFSVFTKERIVKGSVKGGDVISGAVEIRQPVITDKGMTTISKYNILSKRTPVTAEVTTYSDKVLQKFWGKGFEPKVITLQKGQTYITSPIGLTIGDVPYIGSTERIGKTGMTNVKIFEISGKQVPTTKEALSKLTKTEVKTWKDLIEQRITGGRPILTKDIPRYLNENQQLVSGYLEEFRYFGKTGKQVTRFQTASIIEPVKEFEGGINIYKTDTSFKDITKSYSRASGKPNILSGIVIEKPAITIEAEKVEKFIEKTTGRRTPLSSTFQEIKQVPIVVPEIPKPRISRVVSTFEKTTTTAKGLPSMVGGTGLVVSEFYGTGQYEVTDVGVVLMPSKTSNVLISDIKPVSTETQKITPISFETQRGGLKLIEENKLTQRDILKLQSKEELKLIQQPKEELKLITKLGLKLQEKLKTEQKLKPKYEFERTTKPKKPPIKIPIIFSTKSSKEKVKETAQGISDFYKVYGRRKGEDILLGTAKTSEEAKGILSGFLTGTLGASGQIKLGGKALSFKEVGLTGREFRPAKKDIFRVVQERGFRLKKGDVQVREIQYYRKKKKKKLGWL